jgi:hypothetical protein
MNAPPFSEESGRIAAALPPYRGRILLHLDPDLLLVVILRLVAHYPTGKNLRISKLLASVLSW